MNTILMNFYTAPPSQVAYKSSFLPVCSCILLVGDLENQIIGPPKYKNSDAQNSEILKRNHKVHL